MQERRKSKRTELHSVIMMKRLDNQDEQEIQIEINDISKTGVGFVCDEPLAIGNVYESYLTIWTKEVLHAFLRIVRIEMIDGNFHYGAIFIGMPEMDAARIEVYQTVNEEGNNIRLADSFRMCHASNDWRQYVIDKYPRVYSELGVPILYVDEFSLRIENRCYEEGHGHEVPSNLLKTDREFISRLKDAVPEELVLYGEYAAVDINARYIDCNITYGFLDSITEMIERSWRAADSDSNLGRVMTDAYRFAFPKIVQLVLPMALRNLSWQPHKFIFWNGEVEYDSFWDLLESDGNDFTCKAYAIKKRYADCFSSDYPEMMIESLSPAICINKFPGKDRTVYTVYNRAYRTYRGEALRIPHVDGNVYYDVWKERPLEVEIENGYAHVKLEVDAQSIGCILVSQQG